MSETTTVRSEQEHLVESIDMASSNSAHSERYHMMRHLRTKHALTVEDVINILGISRTKAYQFINDNPPFHVVSVGSLKKISAKSFFEWLDGEIPKNLPTTHTA